MKRFFSTLLGGLLLSATFTASAAGDRGAAPPIISWQPPAFYRAPSSGRTALVQPAPYVPVTPCRVYNSLSFTKLADNTPRTITLSGAPCTIPTTAVAVAVNITIFNINAFANGVFRVDTVSPPTVAWINYPPTETQRGNAGVVSTTGPANIIVQANQGGGNLDFVVDVFGFYGPITTTGSFFMQNDAAGDYAVLGIETGTSGIGLYGFTTGAGGRGVFAYNGTANGYGVMGTNPLGIGVEGNSTSGTGVKGYEPALPVGTDFSAGVAGESSNSWGMFAKTNTGCNMVALRVSAANVFQNEVDMGCSNVTAASFYGTVNVFSDTGGPGDLHVSGNVTKGGGSFKIDHPLDPENKYLYHSFVESPDMKNVYDGVVELDGRGEAVVLLPDYFEALNSDFRYQLTSIGRHAPIFIADEVGGNQFRIAGGRPGMRVSWQVTGIRKDAWANAHRIIPEVAKEPDMQGRYLHPLELGKSLDKGPTERPQSRIILETQR
jgi:hypothetical protein